MSKEMKSENEVKPAFIVYDDEYLAARKSLVGTPDETKQMVVEIICGQLAAEGKIPFMMKEGYVRPNVQGADVVPFLHEIAERHRAFVATRKAEKEATPTKVSLQDANRKVAALRRYVEGDGNEWKGVIALNSHFGRGPIDAEIAKVEEIRKSLALDFTASDFGPVIEAADAARAAIDAYLLSEQKASVERQIGELTGDVKTSALSELEKAGTDGKAVRALGTRLASAGAYDPQRKKDKPQPRRAGDPLGSLGDAFRADRSDRGPRGKRFSRGDRDRRPRRDRGND